MSLSKKIEKINIDTDRNIILGINMDGKIIFVIIDINDTKIVILNIKVIVIMDLDRKRMVEVALNAVVN